MVVEHQKRESHLVKFSLDGKITVLKSSLLLVVGRGMGALFGQEESFLLLHIALSAEKCINTHVHICALHILAGNAKS